MDRGPHRAIILPVNRDVRAAAPGPPRRSSGPTFGEELFKGDRAQRVVRHETVSGRELGGDRTGHSHRDDAAAPALGSVVLLGKLAPAGHLGAADVRHPSARTRLDQSARAGKAGGGLRPAHHEVRPAGPRRRGCRSAGSGLSRPRRVRPSAWHVVGKPDPVDSDDGDVDQVRAPPCPGHRLHEPPGRFEPVRLSPRHRSQDPLHRNVAFSNYRGYCLVNA